MIAGAVYVFTGLTNIAAVEVTCLGDLDAEKKPVDQLERGHRLEACSSARQKACHVDGANLHLAADSHLHVHTNKVAQRNHMAR